MYMESIKVFDYGLTFITIGVGTCWKQGGAQEVAVINYKLILVNNY